MTHFEVISTANKVHSSDLRELRGLAWGASDGVSQKTKNRWFAACLEQVRGPTLPKCMLCHFDKKSARLQTAKTSICIDLQFVDFQSSNIPVFFFRFLASAYGSWNDFAQFGRLVLQLGHLLGTRKENL